MITIEKARKILGETGKEMADKEIEKLRNQLYSLINQILDNNLDLLKPCKKQ